MMLVPNDINAIFLLSISELWQMGRPTFQTVLGVRVIWANLMVLFLFFWILTYPFFITFCILLKKKSQIGMTLRLVNDDNFSFVWTFKIKKICYEMHPLWINDDSETQTLPCEDPDADLFSIESLSAETVISHGHPRKNIFYFSLPGLNLV